MDVSCQETLRTLMDYCRIIGKEIDVFAGLMRLGALLSLMMICCLGCKDASMQQLDERQKQMSNYKNRKVLKPSKSQPALKTNPNVKRRQPIVSDASDLEQSYQASRSTAFNTGRAEEVALRRIGAAVKASLDVGPTLVVWLIDRTPSANKLVTDGVASAKALYDSEEVRQAATAADPQLLSAVVMFDDQVEFALDPPTGDVNQVKAAFDALKPAQQGKESTFTAIEQTLAKYLAARRDERREVILVVMTDEAGDDQDKVDSLVDIVKRNAIPIYVIGSPAPWGQTNPYLATGMKPSDPSDDTFPTHGPESLMSERVNIQMGATQVGFAAAEDVSMIDSGFGPFALERLCRASGGEFIAIRPSAGSIYQYRSTNMGHKFWPTGNELRFDPQVVARYAPDYVSKVDFDELLKQNKARQALVDAAKQQPIEIGVVPSQRFEKKNEAQMARQLNSAQQFAARHSPTVDQLYELLNRGEADRDKETSPRIQAEYDLAMGRTMAAKVRLDGYNSMLAALKRGKNFENANSREWLLEQSSKIETGSTIQKMAEKATMYLQRVVSDHPGTPWAKLAEQELKNPLGWEWKEN